MPNIYDNIDLHLLPILQGSMKIATHADFCVGYFNLRGWSQLSEHAERWKGGPGAQARVLVGMQRLPADEARHLNSFVKRDESVDATSARRLKAALALEFRKQLEQGRSTPKDQAELLKLAHQLETKQVAVKLHCRHPLHAKLYLLHLQGAISPRIGFLGSSNLTYSGLGGNGELNVDIKDDDAALKLSHWFDARWNDRFSLDISLELAQILRESWIVARSPYHVYLKMAYHLSQEAREGQELFSLPHPFDTMLFEYQSAAVKMAARNLNKRGGAMIGDVVGLGKTVMASAVAKIFTSAPYHLEVLVICPASLTKMWNDARTQFGVPLTVISFDSFLRQPPEAAYRLVVIDESHNLRSGEGARYRAIERYLKEKNSRVLLLSATPYNKTYLDLSQQLRLFIEPDKSLGIKPNEFFRTRDEATFRSEFGVNSDTLAAFEKSPFPDDWRELMRLYLVRRTRSFIQQNYAKPDGDRRYLEYPNGDRFYFPARTPKTLKFAVDESDKHDQFARLYATDVVDTINALNLPRYGLGQYVSEAPGLKTSPAEDEQIGNLGRAGKRLMGFCRTNLFKRFESSGEAFILSLERHIARNRVFLHALEHNLNLPIGTQGAGALDEAPNDLDYDGDGDILDTAMASNARAIYDSYVARPSGLKWMRADLFVPELAADLAADNAALAAILRKAGDWKPDNDAKLQRLLELIEQTHATEKVLVFSQFADTIDYLERELKARGVTRLGAATGGSGNPTELAHRFSPVSNGLKAAHAAPANAKESSATEDSGGSSSLSRNRGSGRLAEPRQWVGADAEESSASEQSGESSPHPNPPPQAGEGATSDAPLLSATSLNSAAHTDELRVLLATDVLSEGQNLQDAHIIVNYDLPWAIIRLIQRAGRVDRIGQNAPEILCYSFLPADGVEQIIKVRKRLVERLDENSEVIGADERFFEDQARQELVDLYHEKSQLDGDDGEGEVDLPSRAYAIWKAATQANPELAKIIERMPDKSNAARAADTTIGPRGALVYTRLGDDTDAMVWLDADGQVVTTGQWTILQAAACPLDTPALEVPAAHHDAVSRAVAEVASNHKQTGIGLGRTTGARYKTYGILTRFYDGHKGSLGLYSELGEISTLMQQHPFCSAANAQINAQLRLNAGDSAICHLLIDLHKRGNLFPSDEEGEGDDEPRLVCSLALV